MRYKLLHSWDVRPDEAVEIQEMLAGSVRIQRVERLETVAGTDVSFSGSRAYAAAVLLDYQDMRLLDVSFADMDVGYPYIPGLLTFREGPVILRALEGIDDADVLLFDGQGIAHPRRFGEASHLGLLLDRPSVGCAKSRLCGEFSEPGKERGSFSLVVDRGEIVGAALRTRTNVKPVFVSPGHMSDLSSAIEIALNCARSHRVPEPLRLAHILSSKRARSKR
ncbi:MAG: endonuclease V [Methanothrix sp.]|uniref:endonuclease V n=1 Tax=Methanothrix sp. TaxID=90426 RepID=UPI0025E0E55F|nr:endonuclease V [Methanothrix sp.]MCQ8903094.1 endonuclease V [Methanothrix sp.]